MIIKDNEVKCSSVSVNFEGSKWGIVKTIVDENGVKTEMTWARGDKNIHKEDL